MENVFVPFTKTKIDTSEDVTKTVTETSLKNNNRALSNLNDKLLNIKNDSDKRASYLLSPPSKNTNPENISQFELKKEPYLHRTKEFLINKTIPVTLYNNLLTFRNTGKKFE